MTAKFLVLAAALFSSSAVTVTKAQTAPNTLNSAKIVAQQPLATTFRCIKDNNGFATIAQRGDRTTPPVITWNATLGQYTPQQRCHQVSQRLTQVVADNGGRLHNLVLTAGTLNNQKVICVVNSNAPTPCNSANLLFTLRPANAKRVGEVVARLHNFSVMGTGIPVQELTSRNTLPIFGGIPVFGENSPSISNESSLPLERLNQFLEPENRTRDTDLF